VNPPAAEVELPETQFTFVPPCVFSTIFPRNSNISTDPLYPNSLRPCVWSAVRRRTFRSRHSRPWHWWQAWCATSLITSKSHPLARLLLILLMPFPGQSPPVL
jgi:hypothetical protein